MKIGSISFDNNVFLAPMAGITGMPFRILCREQGCGLVYTEMVSAKGMHYNNARTFDLIRISESEKPVGIQIFGSDPNVMVEMTSRLNDSEACLVDINMGCPTPKITKNGEGSALMTTPDLAARIIYAVSNVSVKPVTVKIRKGWNDQSINAVDIAKIAEQNGASAVTVHGRTREQFYSGKADWEIIAAVKSSVKIPVIGNGDIVKPEDAVRMMNQTGCDAVMIGRGAQGNPWIFGRTLEYLKTGKLVQEPTIAEKMQTMFRHMDMLIGIKGERIGICEMRKHIAWYIKGIRHAAHIKETVFKANTKEEIISVLGDLLPSIDY